MMEKDMKLRKIIATTIREYLNEQKILNENEIDDLYSYFNKSEKDIILQLPHEIATEKFSLFLRMLNIPSELPKKDGAWGGEELLNYLENNNKPLYIKYANWLYDEIKNFKLFPYTREYPTWAFYDANKKELINEQWLIHFTDSPEAISQEGFTFGVNNINKLGNTSKVHHSEIVSGYSFAYTLKDFVKDSFFQRSKKGAVIFKASGIRIFHKVDNEYQVIFYGNTAKNIIPIIKEGDSYIVKDKSLSNVLFKSEDFDSVVNWVINKI